MEDTLPNALKNCRTYNNGDFSVESSSRDLLEKQWVRAVGSDPSCRSWFERLWKFHSEETRHYHTVVHLQEMLENLVIVENFFDLTPDESKTIILAVFFHDAVYDGTSATNEEDSEQLFQEFANDQNLDSSLKQKVSDCIIATKKHSIGDQNSREISIFLDLDMSVLGKAEQAYLLYAGLIRKEYHFVPPATYCSKRSEILETFLGQSAIYGTPELREALEPQARSNLSREIDMLRKGEIPK